MNLSGYGDPVFEDCEFISNTVAGETSHGGALYVMYDVIARISGTTFRGNGAGYGGGAIYSYCATLRIDRCTFEGNSAPWGGTLQLEHLYAADLTRCVIAFSAHGEAISTDNDQVTLRCCDLYGNAGGDWTEEIADQLGSAGNICADPLFCDAAAGDLRLNAASPCLPGVNPDCGLIGAWPVGCPSTDVTPDGAHVWRLSLAPNPCRGAGTVRFVLPPARDRPLELSIHDPAGRLVRRLLGSPAASEENAVWDGRDEVGSPVPPGVYFLRLAAGPRRLTQAIVVVR